MEIGLITKVLFFAAWPFLLLGLYYLMNKQKFLARWQKLKDNGLFK